MKLKLCLLFILSSIYLQNTSEVQAITQAQQTQDYSTSLKTWQLIQELGSNLDGPLGSFTFRVQTTSTNKQMFDYTAQNTRIYDKSTPAVTIAAKGCGSGDPNDGTRGLTFNTTNVPSGYEDVTVNFTPCNNYNFINGHKYLILVTNANMPTAGGLKINFAISAHGTDYFTNGELKYSADNKACDPVSYVWNSSTNNSGCNIFNSTSDDLYFSLTNSVPPPKQPVIFIPGIGGSELKANQDIFWNNHDSGHNSWYSHQYAKDEKIWLNQDQAIIPGDDDYFDVLRLLPDGQTSEADIGINNFLSPFGYSDIDNFFTSLGYVKNTNFFTFAYDWRKDIRNTKNDLDALINTAKQKSGQNQVIIIAHSMGGLVARYYIADSAKAQNVSQLISLGTPYVGTAYAIKTLLYGTSLDYTDAGINIPIIPGSEVKDIFQTLPSAFELLPSSYFYNFYDNSEPIKPYPFDDERDIDNNHVTGALNFNQTKDLILNQGYNQTVFGLNESFHHDLDPTYNTNTNVKLYNIVGSGEPTIGQIQESWAITWPINLLPKYQETYVNGDNTVPLYSAALKSDKLDLSAGATLYYVDQQHTDLTNKDGVAMQVVKFLLNEANSLPVDVSLQKINLEGQSISVDQDADLDLYDDQGNHTGLKDGKVETKIPKTSYSSIKTTKSVFVKKSANKVTVKATLKKSTPKAKTSLKISQYTNDQVTKQTVYQNLPITQPDTQQIQFILDPSSSTAPAITITNPDNSVAQTVLPTAELTGNVITDTTPPITQINTNGIQDTSGNYISNVNLILTATDPASGSGVLQTEYSLDNGQTVQDYTQPITVSTPGNYTLQVSSTDNIGNQELPQSLTFTVLPASSSAIIAATPSAILSSNNSSSLSLRGGSDSTRRGNLTTSKILTSGWNFDPPFDDNSSPSGQVLGLSIKKPFFNEPNDASGTSDNQRLWNFLKIPGFILCIAIVALALTFIKPILSSRTK